ncbi:hypothetical protein [Moorena sp. SIO2C4]|uniref:hypothetical protein n=1 Tax=Moorena sp. SIO2C4 TaxID=2607824 RepID=UPI0013CCAF30|nr:hypothetical protein [Moorena sp. SIO2C4]NES40528.1 hypothetical protein [Moorena sp. SIO2C4]
MSIPNVNADDQNFIITTDLLQELSKLPINAGFYYLLLRQRGTSTDTETTHTVSVQSSALETFVEIDDKYEISEGIQLKYFRELNNLGLLTGLSYDSFRVKFSNQFDPISLGTIPNLLDRKLITKETALVHTIRNFGSSTYYDINKSQLAGSGYTDLEFIENSLIKNISRLYIQDDEIQSAGILRITLNRITYIMPPLSGKNISISELTYLRNEKILSDQQYHFLVMCMISDSGNIKGQSLKDYSINLDKFTKDLKVFERKQLCSLKQSNFNIVIHPPLFNNNESYVSNEKLLDDLQLWHWELYNMAPPGDDERGMAINPYNLALSNKAINSQQLISFQFFLKLLSNLAERNWIEVTDLEIIV